MTRYTMTSMAAALAVCAATVQWAHARQSAAPQASESTLERRAEQQIREGKEKEAVELARQSVAASPTSADAHFTLGSMLDFAGMYKEARDAFEKSEQVATDPDDKARARRAIAVSYGFERDCASAVKHDEPVYREYVEQKDFNTAGGVANELARLCLDAGDIDVAERWYRTGVEAGLRQPDLNAQRQDLWRYRLEHALGRIAARRGNKADATKHVAAAKEILERGSLPEEQKVFFPYLAGYVALYTGDYNTGLTELQQANQEDAYVLGLIAQTYEKLGQNDKALEYYRKVMASTAHNPTTAATRPLAREKLGAAKQ